MTPGLRVAFVAGTLARGGAEKQLVYAARALATAGAEVRVLCLTRGESLEGDLQDSGLAPEWLGSRASPPARLLGLTRSLARFRPHIVQSAHFYTNLYATLAAPAVDALAIGALRNDAVFEVRANGRWGPWLLRAPPVLFANSAIGRANAEAMGRRRGTVRVVPNVIDPATTGPGDVDAAPATSPRFVVAGIARHVPAKRLDRFLHTVALARRTVPHLSAVLAGAGPETDRLRALARELGLAPDAVRFLGEVTNVADVCRRADALLLTSDHEGFPNVLLEAMAHRLPVVTTPAGDAAIVVRDGDTGFVVPHDDLGGLAGRLIALARSPELRRRLGDAGRRRVEAHYNVERLAERLAAEYLAAAAWVRHRPSLSVLGRCSEAPSARSSSPRRSTTPR